MLADPAILNLRQENHLSPGILSCSIQVLLTVVPYAVRVSALSFLSINMVTSQRGGVAQIRKNHAPSLNSGNREVNRVWCVEAQSLEVGQAGWKGHVGEVLWLEPWTTSSLWRNCSRMWLHRIEPQALQESRFQCGATDSNFSSQLTREIQLHLKSTCYVAAAGENVQEIARNYRWHVRCPVVRVLKNDD